MVEVMNIASHSRPKNPKLYDTKYGMKSDNFLNFRLTIHPVYIGDYKRRKRKQET